MRLFLSVIILFSCSFAFEYQFEIEDTNILSKERNSHMNDYNRLRVYAFFEHEKLENTTFKIILDNENRYNLNSGKNSNNSKIYRAYLKYGGEKHLFVAGLQRIPFGVGRIWNPIDIFNPIDSTAIESYERKGTESIRYEYAISELSNFDATVSKDKMSVRIKGFFKTADLALVALKDNESDKEIFGYELQGELFDSGIEIRSEGAHFRDRMNTKNYYEYILGAEYGFENSLTVLGEYKHNSDTEIDYLASNISYQINTLLSISILGIKNLEDKSSFISPRLDYSFSDDMDLTFGSFFYSGDKGSEFKLNNKYFLKFFIHF